MIRWVLGMSEVERPNVSDEGPDESVKAKEFCP